MTTNTLSWLSHNTAAAVCATVGTGIAVASAIPLVAADVTRILATAVADSANAVGDAIAGIANETAGRCFDAAAQHRAAGRGQIRA